MAWTWSSVVNPKTGSRRWSRTGEVLLLNTILRSPFISFLGEDSRELGYLWIHKPGQLSIFFQVSLTRRPTWLVWGFVVHDPQWRVATNRANPRRRKQGFGELDRVHCVSEPVGCRSETPWQGQRPRSLQGSGPAYHACTTLTHARTAFCPAITRTALGCVSNRSELKFNGHIKGRAVKPGHGRWVRYRQRGGGEERRRD